VGGLFSGEFGYFGNACQRRGKLGRFRGNVGNVGKVIRMGRGRFIVLGLFGRKLANLYFGK